MFQLKRGGKEMTENKVCMLTWLILGILVLIFIVYRYIAGRKKEKSVFQLNTFIAAIYIIAFLIFNTMIVYDKNGVMYEIEDFYDNAFFYTESEESFRIEGDYLVCTSDNNLKYSIDICFIDENGYLIFDSDKAFKKTEFIDVYFNGKDKVYPVRSCSWNMWGKLVIPEYKGINVQDKFFYFHNTVYERMMDIEMEEQLSALMIILWVPVAVSLVLFSIYSFGRIYDMYLYTQKKNESVGAKAQMLSEKYFSKWELSFVIAIEAGVIEEFATSLYGIIVFLILYGIVIWMIIPYAQGAMVLDNEAFESATLKQLKAASNSRAVRKGRIGYLIGVIYISIGIILRVFLCS